MFCKGEKKKATQKQFIQMLPFLYVSLRCMCVYRLITSHYLTVVLEQVCALGLSANIRGLSCTSKYSIIQCRQRRFY